MIDRISSNVDGSLHITLQGYGVILSTSNSLSNRLSQTNFSQIRLIDLYSASAEDNETVTCFLYFQDIGESPNNMKMPLTLLLVIGQDARSESQNASTIKL